MPRIHRRTIQNRSSIQFSCSVVSDFLQPPELQHASPPCPSPTPGVYSNLCPLSRWCHLIISPSVIPFFFLFCTTSITFNNSTSSRTITLKCVFSSVQSLTCVRLFVIPWTAACQASQSIHNSQSLLKLKCTELVVPSNHLILYHPLLIFHLSQHKGLF